MPPHLSKIAYDCCHPSPVELKLSLGTSNGGTKTTDGIGHLPVPEVVPIATVRRGVRPSLGVAEIAHSLDVPVGRGPGFW